MAETDNHQMDLDRLARSFTPTIVTAPTARNGITLVQRLLNSTRQTMIFGENKQLVEVLPHMAASNHSIHVNMRQELEASRRKFLEETTEYWSSDLWPDTGRLMMIAFEMFYKAVMAYQQSAQDCGFSKWGIKHPVNGPNTIHVLGQLLQTARFVMVYRNPFDVVASAKARQFITNPAEVAKYAGQWRKNLQAVRDSPPPHLMMIRHETLTAEPEPVLQELETFAGVSGIDRSVLSRKINTFQGQTERGHAPSGYIEPVELTEQERQLIYDNAGDMLEWAGYTSQGDNQQVGEAPASAAAS